MNGTRHLLSLALLLPTCAALGACAAAAAPDDDDAGDAAGASAAPIRGGAPATAYPEGVLIDMERDGVTVALCSGALIAPRAVLTAGHCVAGFDAFHVVAPHAGGQEARSTSAVTYDYTTTSEHVDPSRHDVGLIFLSTPITLARYPTIASAPLREGDRLVNVGRVRSGAMSGGSLFVGKPVRVASGAQRGFPFDYVAAGKIEHGDSGGPCVVPGSSPHRIAAVNSGAGDGIELLARVDLLEPWIRDEIARREGDACGGVTYEGECAGDVLFFCDGGLQSADCAAEGLSCGWDGAEGLATCL